VLLERIATRENTVQAFQWIDPDRALDRAREADLRRKAGDALGPCTAFRSGSRISLKRRASPPPWARPYSMPRAARSAALVQLAEAAGAFVMARPSPRSLPTSIPARPATRGTRPTRRADRQRLCAAVAMGFLPGAVGTQTNGSVIRPAAFCGVVGYKPTAGLISLAGVHPSAPAWIRRACSPAAFPTPPFCSGSRGKGDVDAAASAGRGVISDDMAAMARSPRLAVVRSPVWHLADPHAQEHFLKMVARLRSAGAEVTEQKLPSEFEGAHAVLRTIMYGEGARGFAELQRRDRDRLSPRLNALIDEGLGIPDSDLARGWRKGSARKGTGCLSDCL